MSKMSYNKSMDPEFSSESSLVFTHRRKLFIALVLLVGALAYFAFMAFKGATVYYYTVSELNAQGQALQGELVRVSGKLLPDSYQRENASTLVRFNLRDTSTGESLQAVYDGVLPDLFFNEHSEIILEGNYQPSGVFTAQNVIVKCPSKYIALSEEG